MVSSLSFSPSPQRTMLKFGEATAPTPQAHKKPEQHESAFMIEVDLKGKEAAQQAPIKKTLVQPLINDTHAALAKIPGMAISTLSAAAIGLAVSKYMAKHAPPVKSFEESLKEARLTERAKETGKIQSKLIGISPLLLIAGGFLTKMGEKAGEKLIEIPASFIPKGAGAVK